MSMVEEIREWNEDESNRKQLEREVFRDEVTRGACCGDLYVEAFLEGWRVWLSMSLGDYFNGSNAC